jgi:hypothetical protein
LQLITRIISLVTLLIQSFISKVFAFGNRSVGSRCCNLQHHPLFSRIS